LFLTNSSDSTTFSCSILHVLSNLKLCRIYCEKADNYCAYDTQ